MVQRFQKSNATGEKMAISDPRSVSVCVCVFLCMYDSVMNTNVTQALFQSHYNPLPSPDNNRAGRTVNSGRGLNNGHQSGLSATRRKHLHTSMPPSVLHFLPSQNSSPRLPLSPSFFLFLLLFPIWLSCNTFQTLQPFCLFPRCFLFILQSSLSPPLFSIKSHATRSPPHLAAWG